MDKEAGKSLLPTRYPHFFQIIVPDHLGNGALEIPQDFVDEHRNYLPKYAYLRISNGKQWKIELYRSDVRVWLHRDWQQITENCSIKDVHALLFRYEGGSLFHVFLFNRSGLEIKFPDRFNINQPEVLRIKDKNDDDNSDLILDWPLNSGEASVANQCGGDDEVLQDKGPVASVIAKEGVLRRARAFQSPNPHFFVIMRSAYHSHLYIPARPGRRYFYGRDDKCIYLIGPNGRAWFMTYRIGGPPLCQVIINKGWYGFAQEYNVRYGDACVFELINSSVMAFNVVIFRIADEKEEVNQDNPVEVSNIPSRTQTGKRKMIESPNFERDKSVPSFTVVFKQKAQCMSAVRVPLVHASRYLMDQHQKQVYLHGISGRTWHVKCYVYYANVKYVRLSSGWKDFVVDNDLQDGDACVFQLLSQAPHHYNVAILRASDQQN